MTIIDLLITRYLPNSRKTKAFLEHSIVKINLSYFCLMLVSTVLSIFRQVSPSGQQLVHWCSVSQSVC